MPISDYVLVTVYILLGGPCSARAQLVSKRDPSSLSAEACVRACVNDLAYEQGLSGGLRTERRLFHMTFATESEDQREGALNVFFF